MAEKIFRLPNGNLFTQGNTTITESTANATTASTTVLAANASRMEVTICNESDETIYFNIAGTAATTANKSIVAGESITFGVTDNSNFVTAITAIHAGTGSKKLVFYEVSGR